MNIEIGDRILVEHGHSVVSAKIIQTTGRPQSWVFWYRAEEVKCEGILLTREYGADWVFDRDIEESNAFRAAVALAR